MFSPLETRVVEWSERFCPLDNSATDSNKEILILLSDEMERFLITIFWKMCPKHPSKSLMRKISKDRLLWWRGKGGKTQGGNRVVEGKRG